MKIDFNQIVPIYIQIADAIEDDILAGRLREGDKCYSQVVIAKELNINPATAAKGIRLLVERGVLDKVRGQAMTVKKGAVDMI
ncbi:MAG: GntR family transcriptional regulator, partial [Lachnospiraceae bacterium]|nr:GntR family transcriptional regulator [Lachnospiraceae bacterium]